MKLSSMLVTATKNGPAKVKDPGLIRLVKAGYAVYDNSAGEMILTPLGVRLIGKISDRFRTAFIENGGQEISGKGGYPALDLMVRILKRESQIPSVLFEERAHSFRITGFSSVLEDVSDSVKDWIRICRDTFSQGGLEVRFLEGVTTDCLNVRMVAKGGKRNLGSEEGFLCPSCGWIGTSSSLIKAKPAPAADVRERERELEEIHTPGATTIAELCRQLEIPPDRTLKTMFYAVDDDSGRLVVSLVRGDRNISLDKLSYCLGGIPLRRATEEELRKSVGDVPGFCGPIGLPENVEVVADRDVENAVNVVVGANRVDYHFGGACWGRDFSTDMVRDIASIGKDSLCPLCGGDLKKDYFTEIASFSPSVTSSKEYTSLQYADGNGRKYRPNLWNGVIDLERVLVSIAGFAGSDLLRRWSPFDVLLISDIPENDRLFPEVEDMYDRLTRNKLTVLLDDRDRKLESKIGDSAEMGIPVKILTRNGSEGELRYEVRSDERENVVVGSGDLEQYLLSLIRKTGL